MLEDIISKLALPGPTYGAELRDDIFFKSFVDVVLDEQDEVSEIVKIWGCSNVDKITSEEDVALVAIKKFRQKLEFEIEDFNFIDRSI